jgi:hypothetical protein
LLAGFVSLNVIVGVAPPNTGAPTVTVTVGRLALAALTMDEKGIAKISPENARSMRIVPELIFRLYAFVGVYIIFRLGNLESIFKWDGQIVYNCLFGVRRLLLFLSGDVFALE